MKRTGRGTLHTHISNATVHQSEPLLGIHRFAPLSALATVPSPLTFILIIVHGVLPARTLVDVSLPQSTALVQHWGRRFRVASSLGVDSCTVRVRSHGARHGEDGGTSSVAHRQDVLSEGILRMTSCQ